MFTDFAIFFKGRAVRKAISRKAIADFTHASDDPTERRWGSAD